MSSNICSMARAAEASSPAPEGVAPTAGVLGQLPIVSDLVHSIANNTRRNIACDFNLADLDWQYEVNGAGYSLFVGGEAADDLLGSAFHTRQGPVSLHRFRNPPGNFRRAYAAIASDGRGGNHAPAYRLPVQEMGVSSRCFQRMPNGVAKIQDASEIGFLFVGGDDRGFHADGISDDPLQSFAMTPQN